MIKANKLYIMLSIVKGCGPMVFILHDSSDGYQMVEGERGRKNHG